MCLKKVSTFLTQCSEKSKQFKRHYKNLSIFCLSGRSKLEKQQIMLLHSKLLKSIERVKGTEVKYLSKVGFVQ